MLLLSEKQNPKMDFECLNVYLIGVGKSDSFIVQTKASHIALNMYNLNLFKLNF